MSDACEQHGHGGPAAHEDELSAVLLDYMNATRRLQTTHETLQREVMRLRDELASKNEELERRRRLAALGELAAGVAHEVRNPLGAIQLYTGLLRKACRESGATQALLDKVDAGVRAIEEVVQDTLALSPRDCPAELRTVADLLQGARDLCGQRLAALGVEVAVRCPAERLAVAAQGHSLRRALMNLIVNAAEAGPADGRVEVCVERAGPTVRIAVRDRGPGIARDVLDRIFNPFFTTKERGTGLGLTIAHRLLEAHGGTIQARNRPEGGAEFVMSLPLATGDGAPRATKAEDRAVSAA